MMTSTPGKKGTGSATMSWDNLAKERVAAAAGVELGQRVASTTRRHSNRAQIQLDREIDDALHAVATLRMARNSSCLIYMLPADVLPFIFYFCTLNNPAFPNWAPNASGWLAVTRVCSLWREIALHTPSLWADIPLNAGERVAEVFLERAKSAPIIVRVPAARTLGPNPAFIKNVQLVSSHIGHTEELSLSASVPLYNAVIEHLLVAAPVLKYADVNSVAYNTNCLDLPANVFIGRAPILRRLTFTNVMLPWTSISWANLRGLIICHCSSPEKSTLRGSFPDLIEGLSAASRLEDLVLHRCLPPLNQLRTSSPTISLKHIQVLDLSGPHEECLRLYQSIDFSPSAHVNVSLCFRNESGADVQKLVPLLRSYFASAPSDTPPVQTLALISNGTYVKLRVWRSLTLNLDDMAFEDSAHIHDPFSATMHSRANFSIELSDMPTSGAQHERDMLADLCRTIPLEDLRRLSLNSFRNGPAWNKGTWLDIFGRAKNVRSVRLHGDAAHSFSAALVTVPDDGSAPRSKARGAASRKFKNTRRQDLFLPELRSLYLEDIHLDGDFSGQPFHTRLAANLRLRSNRAPIDSLYFTDCTLYDEMLEEFENIQGLNVVWDGSHGDFESDDDDYMESDLYLSDFL
ncbi:hypothetical protein PENSPDRAFT_749293 [Peniophora sp. CONT]|nr:hypothetical protein PENSPDRAFT_749293 [Peniophora sp. CONT]